MNILILTHAYPPEIRSTSNLMVELSEELSKQGNKVTVITPLPKYNVDKIPEKFKRKLFTIDDEKGIKVIRVITLPIHLVGPVLRGIGYLALPIVFFFAGVFSGKQDIIIVYSPPPTIGLGAYWIGKIKRIPFILNVQDLFPQNAIDIGILKNKYLIRLFQKLEKYVYKKARFIAVHSQGNKSYIENLGFDRNKIKIINNWVDTDMIKPIVQKDDYGLLKEYKNKFLVLFAGVMGFAQDLDIIVDAANELKSEKNIVFLLFGDGIEKERIQKKINDLNLKNIVFFPFVSRDEYPKLVNAVDLGVVTLKPAMKTPVVPSKILGYMAAGKSYITSLNYESDARQITEEAKCGYNVDPGDYVEFARKIKILYEDRSLLLEMGKNGRKYAEEKFSKSDNIQKYIYLFNKI